MRAARCAPALLCAAILSCTVSDQAREVPQAAAAASALPTGDWLVMGDVADPASLNCARITQTATKQICRLVGDSLIDFDQGFKLIPRLAESFEVAPGGLQITFRLRSGVRWHDGHPFGARDVLYTIDLRRRLDPKGDQFRVDFGPLADVTAPDDRTIRATYASPFAGALVGWREMIVMPAHLPIDPQAPSPLDRAPVGTGPFRFVSWEAQQQIVLKANEDYFAGRPQVDRYVHRIVPNAEALRAAAEAGAVDVAGLSADWLAEHSPPDRALPFRVEIYPSSRMDMIYWNLEAAGGLFKDPRVRRAMTMLIDRDGYVSRIQHGLHRVPTTLIDSSLWGGDPALKPWPFDPAGAARLLDEAGFKDVDGDGLREAVPGALAAPATQMSFTLLYSSASADHRAIAGLFERAAAQAGVKVRLQALEWAVMSPTVRSRKFDAALFRWNLEPMPDPAAYFHSSQIASGNNFGGYRSAQFDNLAEEFNRTLDPARSAQILVALQRILHDDQPCSFIAMPSSIAAINKRFHTPSITVSGLWNWYPSLQRWWVAPEDRKYR